MSNCALDIGGVFQTLGEVTASSRGTTLGTTYTELSAATAMDYEGFFLNVHKGATTSDVMLDVGIGAASSEQTIIDDIYFCGVTSDAFAAGAGSMFIPLRIPKGSRVAARSTSAVSVTLIGCNGSSGRMSGFGQCTTFGASGTDGLQLAGNATANNKGAWTEFSASLARPIKAIMGIIGRDANTALTDADFTWEIGIGAAGSEQTIIAGMPFTVDAVRDIMQPRIFGPFPVSLAAGIRLAARLQSSTNNNPDRNMDAVLYGFS